MNDPNPDSPLYGEAAAMFQESREMYDRTALTWTKYFAHGNLLFSMESRIFYLWNVYLNLVFTSGVHSYTPFEEMIDKIEALNCNRLEALTLLTAAKWNANEAANNVF